MLKSSTKKIIVFSVVLLAMVGLLLSWQGVAAQDTFGLNDAQVNGLSTQTDLKVTIKNILNVAFGFLGIIAVILILYAGFIWMTAAGDATKIDKAKKIIIGAVIGLIIILSAYSIVAFVFRSVGQGSTEACSPDGSVSSCGINGCGERVCTNGYWSACDTATSACSFYTNDRYTYLTDFSSPSLSWNRSVGPFFSGVVGVPKVGDLTVSAYGRNRQGVISDFQLYQKNSTNDEIVYGRFTPDSGGSELTSTINWDISSDTYSVKSWWQLRSALVPGGVVSETTFSSGIKTLVRPAHCFNGVIDVDETDVDCGGDDCGACGGESCGLQCSDENCASGVCLADNCLCALSPVITSLDPDNGAPGNYVTIFGRNFGDEPGLVFFDNEQAQLDLPTACGDVWQSSQIIVRVPSLSAGITVGVRVVTAEAAGGLSSADKDFKVNSIIRPGICNMIPAAGTYPTTTDLFGVNFPTSGIQNIVWSFSPDNTTSTGTNWLDSSARDTVPENRSGRTIVRVYNGSEYSNGFRFLASAGGVGDPCGFAEDLTGLDKVCSAASVCRSGLVCDFSASCTCQEPPSSCGNGTVDDNEECDGNIFKDNKNQCSDYGFGYGALNCSAKCRVNTSACALPKAGYSPATQSSYSWFFKTVENNQPGASCGYSSYGVCDAAGCSGGLVCNVVGSDLNGDGDYTDTNEISPCTCQASSKGNCGNNILDSGEACDLVDDVVVFSQGSDACGGYLKNSLGMVSCNLNKCSVTTDQCYFPKAGLGSATQSIYSWLFRTAGDSRFGAPRVIESCNRSFSCRSDQNLPSPTPWTSEWNSSRYPNLNVTEPKACVDALISARFTVGMDVSSLKGGVVLLRQNGTGGWDRVSGDVDVLTSDGKWQDDFFILTPNSALTVSSKYKVILRQTISSYTFVPIAVDKALVQNRNCNVGGVTDAAYCWDFETRDSSIGCPEGCVDCNPDPSRMYWYNQTTNYIASLDSGDNVCLMINPNYKLWSWDSDKDDKLAITNSDFNLDGRVDAKQVGTALGETIRDNPNPFARLMAALPVSGKSGICRVYNDFTNPIVVEDKSCVAGTVQSPSPFILTEDACLNAAISARFSRPMVDNSVTQFGNIIVQKCASYNDAISSDQDAICDNVFPLIADDVKNIKVFDYSQEVTPADFYNGTEQAVLPEGFVIDKDLQLSKNSWYRVIILGGNSGVRGSRISGDKEIEEAQGILLTPTIEGFDHNRDGDNDYYWVFKTAGQICPINSINVSPAARLMRYTTDQQEYNAYPQAQNCNTLNRCQYNWDWWSLLNLDDQTGYVASEHTNDSGNIVAKIKNWNYTCAGVSTVGSDPLRSPTQTVFAQNHGLTYIKAIEPQNKSGFGYLRVGLGGLMVSAYQPKDTRCSNPNISVKFNSDSKSVSLLGNINLYRCVDSDCLPSAANKVSLNFLYPENNNPELTEEVTLKTGELSSGNYRVVISGGPDGVKSWNGRELSSLNFNSFKNNNRGEECEPGVYPWNLNSNYCLADKCILNPTTDLCGTDLAECSKDNAAYCDSTCHNIGNTNAASCGNSIIEKSEDCDDGNALNGDGCGSTCLFEGSNEQYNSHCGNGRIEYGETCDDGNTASGDGCSNICLNETRGNLGSQQNVPICGNGVKEISEDCDDGNTASGDGCSNICLSEGATGGAVCGNKVVESGKQDSFSWVFNINNDAAICPLAEIKANNCPNGVWEFEFGQGLSVNKNNIVICRSTTAVAISPWSKLLASLRGVFSRVFGQTGIAGEGDLCGSGYIRVTDDNFEISQFARADNIMVVNYIPKDGSEFQFGVRYKGVVDYNSDGKADLEKTIKMKDVHCPIADIKLRVWPRGEMKDMDTFFCSGDDCGRNDNDLYSHDVSAVWNTDAINDSDKFDFPLLSVDGTEVGDPNYSGNQHFYQLWAVSADGYLLKNQGLGLYLTNPAFVSQTPFNTTQYNGDLFVTAGDKNGDTQLGVNMRDYTGAWVSRNFQIKVFLCHNPWPSPQYFPYYDKTNINTNFEIYYCRDNGADGTADDLPALSYQAIINGQSDNDLIKEYLFRRELAIDETGSEVVFSKTGDRAEAYYANCPTTGAILYSGVGVARTADCDLQYKVNVPQAGNYQLILTSANEDSSLEKLDFDVQHQINIRVDGNLIGQVAPLASVSTTPQRTTVLLPNLSAGEHTIILDWLNDFYAPVGAGDYDSNLMVMKLEVASGFSRDAVGIRVIKNSNHYSPLKWYQKYFAQASQGEPQEIKVDGYQAVVDGRTVYVAASDLNNTASNIFTNIYLMSYNSAVTDNESSVMRSIYLRLLDNWHFNYGPADEGGLTTDFGQCSGDASYQCLTNALCSQYNAGYCHSSKAALTRDVKRLADLQYINSALNSYFTTKRCSADQTKSCSNNNDCYGSGICGNYYPNLTAGSYVAGRTFSVWPSWQSALGNVVASALPIDPFNVFTGCDAGAGYNSVTCWNEIKKNMSCPTDDSFVYTYYTLNQDNNQKGVYAHSEYDKLNGDTAHNKWQPAWSEVEFMQNDQVQNPFVGFDVGSICGLTSSCNNDGTADTGENCYSCPNDVKCPTGTTCQAGSTGWACLLPDADADGISNEGDNCPEVANVDQLDRDQDGVGDVCDNCGYHPNGSKKGTCVGGDHAGQECYSDECTGGFCSLGQEDSDDDGIGDVCDNCRVNYNPNQDNVDAADRCYCTGADNVQCTENPITRRAECASGTPTFIAGENDFYSANGEPNGYWRGNLCDVAYCGNGIIENKNDSKSGYGNEICDNRSAFWNQATGKFTYQQSCIPPKMKCCSDSFNQCLEEDCVFCREFYVPAPKSADQPTKYLWVANNNTSAAAQATGATVTVSKIASIVDADNNLGDIVHEYKICQETGKYCVVDYNQGGQLGLDQTSCQAGELNCHTTCSNLSCSAVALGPSRVAVNASNGEAWVAYSGASGSGDGIALFGAGGLIKFCDGYSSPSALALNRLGDVWLTDDGGLLVQLAGNGSTSCLAQKSINLNTQVYGASITSDDNLWLIKRGGNINDDGLAYIINPASTAPQIINYTNVGLYGLATNLSDQATMTYFGLTGGDSVLLGSENNGSINIRAIDDTVTEIRTGVGIDSSGNMWVTDYNINTFEKISRVGAVSSINVSDGGNLPVGVSGDSAGFVWGVMREPNVIGQTLVRLNGDGGNQQWFFASNFSVGSSNQYSSEVYGDFLGLNRLMLLKRVDSLYPSGDPATIVEYALTAGARSTDSLVMQRADRRWGKVLVYRDEFLSTTQVRVFVCLADDKSNLNNCDSAGTTNTGWLPADEETRELVGANESFNDKIFSTDPATSAKYQKNYLRIKTEVYYDHLDRGRSIPIRIGCVDWLNNNVCQ